MNAEQRKSIFESVFFSHRWGDASNSGKGKNGNYVRRYSKTKKDKGLIKVDAKGNEVK